MQAEYLLFNVVVIIGPLALAWWPRASFSAQYVPAFLACVIAAVPYIIWDALVAGAHWDFNPAYTLGWRLFGLPIEEILFFITVPFACLYTWAMPFRGNESLPNPALRFVYPLLFATLPIGGWAYSLGKEYTGLMLISLAVAGLLDLLLETRLALRPRFWGFLGMVFAFTFVFNGYLTGRPVVTYGEEYQVGFRLFTTPIEDFGYGTSLIFVVVILFERFTSKHSPFLDPFIRKRFGGYRHQQNVVDESLPLRTKDEVGVAVIGSGLAGLTAATYLAERGLKVTLFEKESYLGGKCGSWPVTLDNGDEVHAEHGFHAFFRHYYNLFRFLEHVGVDRNMRQIEDYLILGEDGSNYSFRHVATTPGMNLVSLAWNGVYRLGPVIVNGTGPKMECFLEYDIDRTYAEFDDISFDEWARSARLPKSLELVFTTFARAFFADRTKISMAELIKSFHFYYLSNDCGLLYDYLVDDYERSLLDPIRKRLEQHGARIQTSTPVESLERVDGKLAIGGKAFDHVVLATNVPGTRDILGGSATVQSEDPGFAGQVEALKAGQRYSVLRLWIDRPLRPDWPVFVITERKQILDSISFIDRAEKASATWAQESGGSVLELHCYAMPDEVPDADVRKLFLAELLDFCPEFEQVKVLGEDLQLARNMTAFHTGLWKERPTTQTPIEGLWLAGDWVKLPYPAMLMESACMSGLLCANGILEQHGLRPEPVFSVPLRGMFAGLKKSPPARAPAAH